ncbi:hypothetical protein [Meridianimarinicoccus marinus]
MSIDVSVSTVRGFVVPKDTPDVGAEQIKAALLNSMNPSVCQGFLDSVGLDSNPVVGSQEWGRRIPPCSPR